MTDEKAYTVKVTFTFLARSKNVKEALALIPQIIKIRSKNFFVTGSTEISWEGQVVLRAKLKETD